MRSVVSYITSGREREGKKERTEIKKRSNNSNIYLYIMSILLYFMIHNHFSKSSKNIHSKVESNVITKP